VPRPRSAIVHGSSRQDGQTGLWKRRPFLRRTGEGLVETLQFGQIATIGPLQYSWRPTLSDPADSLSDSQKTCLRLVSRGMTSKEIAQATGLAPQTVDTYLKVAMHRLKAPTRRDAARRFAQQELSHNLGSPLPALAPTADSCDEQPATRNRGWVNALIPPPLGGTVNDLTYAQRTYAVLKVAAISAAAVFALTLAVAGIFETFS
jgi:DNA-binding CsgD family transcriptional regulator